MPGLSLVCSLKSEIIGVKTQMQKFDYVFGVVLGERILKHADNLSKTLQHKHLSAENPRYPRIFLTQNTCFLVCSAAYTGYSDCNKLDCMVVHAWWRRWWWWWLHWCVLSLYIALPRILVTHLLATYIGEAHEIDSNQ